MKFFTYHSSDNCLLYATIINRTGESKSDHEESLFILLHGGGPDHHSMLPLAQQLADLYTVVLPDIRGYGRSVCADPSCHTWAQYAKDIIALLDHLGAQHAILCGAGLGTTIALRTAVAHPDRIRALALISIEDIEDDRAKEAEIAFMDAFANRVRTQGIETAWEPILNELAPIIGTLVRDAISRSDPTSIAAAAVIAHDRSFRRLEELAVITVPTLIIPGMDQRHPAILAECLASILPNGKLAPVKLSADLQTAKDFANAFAPVIRHFLTSIATRL